jgi:hypothetical protein
MGLLSYRREPQAFMSNYAKLLLKSKLQSIFRISRDKLKTNMQSAFLKISLASDIRRRNL